MSAVRKVSRIAGCVGLAWCAWVFASATSAAEEPAKTPKLWAADEMRWEEDKRLPGVKSVLLWGDPQTGEHGMLRKFPAGFAPPLHTHPSVERLVVISGTVLVGYAGSTDKRLGPGSYSEIPAVSRLDLCRKNRCPPHARTSPPSGRRLRQLTLRCSGLACARR